MFVCHPEPQLKECQVFTLYPEPQLKRYHFEPQLKEHSYKSTFKVSLKPCRPRTSKANNHLASALSPDVALELPGNIQLQTAWWKSRAARRQTPMMPLTLQVELSKRVTRPDPARPTTGWWFSEPTQPDSFFSEPKKVQTGPTHHGLAG